MYFYEVTNRTPNRSTILREVATENEACRLVVGRSESQRAVAKSRDPIEIGTRIWNSSVEWL